MDYKSNLWEKIGGFYNGTKPTDEKDLRWWVLVFSKNACWEQKRRNAPSTRKNWRFSAFGVVFSGRGDKWIGLCAAELSVFWIHSHVNLWSKTFPEHSRPSFKPKLREILESSLVYLSQPSRFIKFGDKHKKSGKRTRKMSNIAPLLYASLYWSQDGWPPDFSQNGKQFPHRKRINTKQGTWNSSNSQF